MSRLSSPRGLAWLAPLSFGFALLCVGNLDAQHPTEGAVLVGKRDRLQITHSCAYNMCRYARADCNQYAWKHASHILHRTGNWQA